MGDLKVLTLLFGGFVWILLALALVVVAITLAIQAWEAACFTGYRMFVKKARKEAIRARERAHISKGAGND